MSHLEASRSVVVIIGTGGTGLAAARRLVGGRRLLLADYSEASWTPRRPPFAARGTRRSASRGCLGPAVRWRNWPALLALSVRLAWQWGSRVGVALAGRARVSAAGGR